MKRKLLLLAAVMTLWIGTGNAQSAFANNRTYRPSTSVVADQDDEESENVESRSHLVIWTRDGAKVAFVLTEQPKVTFENQKVVVTTSKAVAEYEAANMLKMTYVNDLPDNIRQLNGKEEVPFGREGEALTFVPGDRDLHVRVYSLKGFVLQDFVVKRGNPISLPLRSLGEDVSLVNVNGVTYKISLR